MYNINTGYHPIRKNNGIVHNERIGETMELREIQYILAIAECGSISKAAQKLYIGQPSLSQFLKNYEIQCGYPLFIRTPRGLVPTKEGDLYIRTAKQITRLQRNLNNQLMELSNLKLGKVVFSLSPFRSPYLLPLVIPAFRQRYPNIEISITEAHMRKQEQLLAEGRVDVGFLSLPLKNKDIPYLEIMQEEIFLAVPNGHPLLAKAHPYEGSRHRWVDFEDLDHRDFLLYSINHRLSDFSDHIFNTYRLTPKVIQIHESFETLIRLAEAGMGLTFIPETYIDARQDLTYLSLGKEGQYRTLVLGYPTAGYLAKATQAFAELVAEKLKERHGELVLWLKEHP